MKDKSTADKKLEIVLMQLSIVEEIAGHMQLSYEPSELHHLRQAYLYLDFVDGLDAYNNADIIDAIWKRHGFDKEV